MSYADEKLTDLARRLIQATNAGLVEWDTTDDPETFVTHMGEITIAVASADNDGREPYVLQVINSRGVVVDSLVGELPRVSAGRFTTPEWSAVLTDLHQRAKRNANQSDRLLDELLDSLPPVVEEEPPF